MTNQASIYTTDGAPKASSTPADVLHAERLLEALRGDGDFAQLLHESDRGVTFALVLIASAAIDTVAGGSPATTSEVRAMYRDAVTDLVCTYMRSGGDHG